MTARSFTLAVLAVVCVSTMVQADNYTGWTKNTAANRYECKYVYTKKAGGTGQQRVYAYTTGPRAGWAYYYNAKGQPWARCAIKGNPKYNAKIMYWQKLNAKGDAYQDYPTKGYCPTPADGAKPIPEVKHPPI